MTDSIGTSWKNILLGWASKSDCLNVSVDDIEQSDVVAFYSNFRETITATDISECDVMSFLKTFYPNFEIHLTDDGSISPTEHIYIYSLLLHFSCVRFQDSYFQDVCQALPLEYQQQIASFFSFIVTQLPIDKENLRRAIANACPKHIPPFLPLESPIRTPKVNKSPPTPHSTLVSELSKDINFLKAQLDAEKDEKNCLEQQLKENEDSLRKLASENKKYVSEISNLKNELLYRLTDISSNNDSGKEQILKKMKKEILEKEEDILNLKESVVTLKDEVKFFKEKCARTECEMTTYIHTIEENSLQIQNLNRLLEEKDSTVKKLSENVMELETFIHESRSSPNSRFDLNASSDSLDLSISRTTNSSSSFSSPENMGAAVVDVQLKEKEIECAELVKQMEKIKLDNAKLAAHVTEQMKQHSKTLNISDIDLLSTGDDDLAQSLFVFSNCLDKFVKEYKIRIDSIQKQNLEIVELKKLDNAHRCRIDELDALQCNNEKTIRNLLKDVSFLNKTVTEKSQQIEFLKKDHDRELLLIKNQKEGIEVQYKEMKETIVRLDNEHKETKEELLKTQRLNAELNQNLTSAKYLLETLSECKNKMEKELSEAQSENCKNVEIIQELSRKISDIKDLDLTHRQRIAEFEDMVHTYEETTKNLSKDLSSYKEGFEEKNQELEFMQRAHKEEILKLQKQWEETEAKKKTAFHNNECINQELKKEKEKLANYENLNSELNKNMQYLAENISKYEKDIMGYQKTISALRKEQSVLQEERNKLKTTLKHAITANKETAENIEQKCQEISQLKQQNETHRNRITELEEILHKSEEIIKIQGQEINTFTGKVVDINIIKTAQNEKILALQGQVENLREELRLANENLMQMRNLNVSLTEKLKLLEVHLSKCEVEISNHIRRIGELEQHNNLLIEDKNSSEIKLSEALFKNESICTELSAIKLHFETASNDYKTEIDGLNKLIKELKNTLEVKETQVVKGHLDLENLRKELNNKIKENSDLSARYEIINARELSCIETIKCLEESVKDKLSINEKLTKTSELYKAQTERKFDQFRDTIQNLEKNLQKKSTLVDKLQMESRTLQGKVMSLTKSLDDSIISFDEINKKLTIRETEIAEYSKELKLANDCRSQLEADKRVLQIESSNLKREISQLEEKSKELESKKLHFEVNFGELSKKYSESESKVASLTESKKAVSEELNRLRAELDANMSSLEKQLNSAIHECDLQKQKITNYENTISKLTEQIAEIRRAEKAVLNENEHLKTEVATLSDKLSDSNDECKCLEMTVIENKKLHLEAKELVESLNKQLIKTKMTLQDLELKHKQEKEDCEAEVRSIRAELSQALMTMDKQNSEIECLQKEIVARDSKIQEVSSDQKAACDENEELRQKIVDLSRNLVIFEREKHCFDQQLEQSNNEISALKSNLKTLEKKCERLEKESQQLEKSETQKVELDKRVRELEAKLTFERSELLRSAAESVSLKENHIIELTKNNETLKGSLNSMLEANKKIEDKLKDVKDINAQLQKSNTELSKIHSTLLREKENCQTTIDELNAQLVLLQTEKDSLDKQYKEISEMHAACLTTKIEFENNLRAKAELCKNLEERYQKCWHNFQELQKTKEGLNKRLETLSVKLGQSQGDLAKSQRDNTELRKRVTNKENEAKKVLANLEKENGKLQNELKALKDSNSLHKNNSTEKLETEKEKSELQKQLKAAKHSECQMAERMKSIEDLNHELEALNQTLFAFVHDVEKELFIDIVKVEGEPGENACISDKCNTIITQLIENRKQERILVEDRNNCISQVNDLKEQHWNILDKMSKMSIKLEIIQRENDNFILDIAKLKASKESALAELNALKNMKVSKAELESNISKEISVDCKAKLEEYKSLYVAEKQLVEKLQTESAILQAKLYKNRANTQEKEKQWSEEKAGLLKDIQRAEERIKDNRLELEGKLEKMKARMRILHKEEVEKIKKKFDHEFGTLKSKYESEFVAMRNEIAGLISKKEKFEEHIQKLSKQLFHSNEKILELQKENKFMEARFNENHKPVTPLWDFPPMNENERDDLQSTFLADLNSGRASFHGRESVCATELQYRNSLAAPHLRSTYAMQYADQQLREDDIKDNILNNLDDSLTSLIHNGQRKKVGGTTSYKKPGPPTPSKNGGRLSLGANELPLKDILKDCNDTSSLHSEKKGSPGKKRTTLFSLSKSKDENVPPTAVRRLSGFFKRNK